MLVDGQGNLFISGDFSQVGPVFTSLIARWNGQEWQDLTVMKQKLVNALGNEPAEVDFRAYDFARKILYVSGLTHKNNGGIYFMAAWQEDNQSWKILAKDLTSPVRAMAIMPAGEVAVTSEWEQGFTIIEPNQTKVFQNSYSIMLNKRSDPRKNDSYHYRGSFGSDLAVSQAGKVFMGGQFDSLNGLCMHGVAAWDGNAWSPLGSGVSTEAYIGPNTAAVQSLALDPNGNLYVAGGFQMAGGKPIHFLAHWTP
jgi:trimeric autotransporter adhesin